MKEEGSPQRHRLGILDKALGADWLVDSIQNAINRLEADVYHKRIKSRADLEKFLVRAAYFATLSPKEQTIDLLIEFDCTLCGQYLKYAWLKQTLRREHAARNIQTGHPATHPRSPSAERCEGAGPSIRNLPLPGRPRARERAGAELDRAPGRLGSRR